MTRGEADLKAYAKAVDPPLIIDTTDMRCALINARLECLKLGSDICRALSIHDPNKVIETARIFEAYVIGDNRKAPAKRGRPRKKKTG